MKINGAYNSATVYTDNIDYACMDQLKRLLNCSVFADSKIRIMPDCHAGSGCVVGYTQTITDKVVANLVGVDICCGLAYTQIPEVNLHTLDNIIHQYVPSGMAVHDSGTLPKKVVARTENIVSQLHMSKTLSDKQLARAINSMGTLGGGNHFIEAAKSTKTGKLWLVVHTGSRNIGLQVCKYWQGVAERDPGGLKRRTDDLIAQLKCEHRESEIEAETKKLRASTPKIPKELAYLEGENMRSYLDDIQCMNDYADLNRITILKIILGKLGVLTPRTKIYTTRHNYIDTDRKIIRKGAVSAEADEQLIIPLNMRAGSLLCVGKGNAAWNYSAPHGAGRVMSRGEAKKKLNLEDYRNAMSGIFTTSVNQSTLDEAPMAYKDADEIERLIGDTVEVIDHLVPVYNFKAGEA